MPIDGRPPTLTWTGFPTPPPCVHDWAHAGVRWWIDPSDPPILVRYIDQFFCRRCLEVASRPIDHRHMWDHAGAVTDGSFAADAVLAVKLRDQAFAGLRPTSADPEPDASAAPTERAD